jgi:hypothetical protein
MAVCPGAVDSGLGTEDFFVPEAGQGVQFLTGRQDDAAAVAAVAAVGSSSGHILFPPKGHRAIATPPRFNLNGDGIDEHGTTCIFLYYRPVLQKNSGIPEF